MLGVHEVSALKYVANEPQEIFNRWSVYLGICITKLRLQGFIMRTGSFDGMDYILTEKGQAILSEIHLDSGFFNGSNSLEEFGRPVSVVEVKKHNILI